jgi:hypothetical protein
MNRSGAYGLLLQGVGKDQPLTWLPSGTDWPAVRIVREELAPPARPESISQTDADVGLFEGDRALMRRAERTATLLSTAPEDGRIIHPFLSAVGVIFAWWDGRHAFHGGAFSGDEGAWCLLGDGASGKSSTLARLVLAGVPVLADDLVVVDRGRLLVGPRCVDLRWNTVEALSLGGDVSAVRRGERFRLQLGAAPAEVPIAGWVFTAWDDTLELRPLKPRERLVRLAAHRCTATSLSPSLLELAALPAWELRRPQTWASLEPAVERLLDLLAA